MSDKQSRSSLRETPAAVAEQLHSAAIQLLRRLRRQDRATGLSGPRASALSVVVFAGPIALGDLAAAEQVRPPTMTRIVQGLEQSALIRRERAPRDRRVTMISATDEGRRVLLQGRDRRVEALARRLARLSKDDLRQLAAGSAVLVDLLPELE